MNEYNSDGFIDIIIKADRELKEKFDDFIDEWGCDSNADGLRRLLHHWNCEA